MKQLIIMFLILLPAISVQASESWTNSQKIAHIMDVIDPDSSAKFLLEMESTFNTPGERVIFIDSPGGRVDSGDEMITAIEAERAAGVHVTCVVTGIAASMAFNFLSHCDVRLATSTSHLLFHKIEAGGWPYGVRMTAKNLREMAKYLDEGDEPFRQFNAKVLGFSLEDYDFYADHNTWWAPGTLEKLGYLQGIINVDSDK